MSGNLEKDSGTIKLNGEKIGYLKQEIPSIYNSLKVIEYLKKEANIDTLEEQMHALENTLNENNMEEYATIQNKYIAKNGYVFEEELIKILSSLYFNKSLNCKISTLSGGEKIKVLLSLLLLEDADILLLDEITNNLDIETIEYLENYLEKSNKKMLIVSHDEVFLNKIVNKIFELAGGKIKKYDLSYEDYLKQKMCEYNKEKEHYLKTQEQVTSLKKDLQKTKEWIHKGTNKLKSDNDKIARNFAIERTKTKNISKLTKKIQNIEVLDFKEKLPIKVFFTFDPTKGNQNIILENLVCGYTSFRTPKINFTIPFSTRVNITGINASGKTTLIKTIMQEIPPLSGSVKLGNDVKIGYISQNTLTTPSEESIYTYITKTMPNIDNSLVFTLLDKFNISYDDKDKSYSILSPGERTRVNLVKLILEKVNVLILDEVTNHLDNEALDLIYELLKDYTGTIISVSHNRVYNKYLNADIELNIKTGNIKKSDNIY